MIFVDTGAFLGRFLPSDQYHRPATTLWQRLEQDRERCFTSNFVLDETFTLLARRSSYSFAANKARALYGSATLQILRPTLDDELAALEFFEKFADQEISFTDCISFVLMRRNRIRRAFSFDQHFERAAFDLFQ